MKRRNDRLRPPNRDETGAVSGGACTANGYPATARPARTHGYNDDGPTPTGAAKGASGARRPALAPALGVMLYAIGLIEPGTRRLKLIQTRQMQSWHFSSGICGQRPGRTRLTVPISGRLQFGHSSVKRTEHYVRNRKGDKVKPTK